jgi:hypothetical protein
MRKREREDFGNWDVALAEACGVFVPDVWLTNSQVTANAALGC